MSKKGGGYMKNDIKVRNFISIDGQPEVPWDSLSKEQQKELAIRMQEKALGPLGFRRKAPGVSA